MAKLILKFEGAVQKEHPLLDSAVTIGRMADNVLQIDNPAVSSHHARLFLERGQYVIEDLNSTNGTYINNKRITKAALKNGDNVLIGKHVVAFEDEVPAEASSPLSPLMTAPESTVVLNPEQAQELMAQQQPPQAASAAGRGAASAPALARTDRMGTLTILNGKTDQSQYVLTAKLTTIGKSENATVKLKAMFAPKAAAVINRREGKYFITAAEQTVHIKINENEVTAQYELADGDIVDVAGVKMAFTYND